MNDKTTLPRVRIGPWSVSEAGLERPASGALISPKELSDRIRTGSIGGLFCVVEAAPDQTATAILAAAAIAGIRLAPHEVGLILRRAAAEEAERSGRLEDVA